MENTTRTNLSSSQILYPGLAFISVASFILKMLPLSPVTTRLPEHNGSIATSDLLFKATLPPLGFSTYFVSETSSKY